MVIQGKTLEEERANKGLEPITKEEESPETKVEPPPKRFYIIQFPGARQEIGDPPRVPVQAPDYDAPQGMMRNTPLPVPASVVEILDHAQYPNWQNVEGENRKVAEWRHRFPFSKICEISEEGYDVLRKKALVEKITEQDYLPFKI